MGKQAKTRKPERENREADGLRKRRNRLYAFKAIPVKLRPAYGGKATLEESTGTDSPSEAITRKEAIGNRWKREFLELEAGGVITPEALAKVRESMKPGADAIKLALDRVRQTRMRETLEWLKDKPYRDDGDVNVRQASGFNEMSDAELGAVLRSQGLAPTPALLSTVADTIHEADTGARNLYDRGRDIGPESSEALIDSMLDTYFTEHELQPRQVRNHRRMVTAFIDWLKGKKITPAIGKVTKELAGQYVTARFNPPARGAKTVNNEISAVSRYWQFLNKKGKATENPFEGQSLSRKLVDKARIRKRPYSEEDMVKLLSGDASQLLDDCIRLLALHGMRAEELCQLRVGDCHGDVFRIYGGGNPDAIPKWHAHKLGKNESARRDIPIHRDAAAIVNRRMKGKADSDYLIHELPTPKKAHLERSKKLSDKFGAYRKSVGVHDQADGQKQSRLDAHSLRRWFIKSAGDALLAGATGFNDWTIADVAGHDAESMPLAMTKVRYPGPSDTATRRKCIESVNMVFEHVIAYRKHMRATGQVNT